MSKVAEWILRSKKWIPWLFGVLALLSIYSASTLRFYHNLERFFPQDDEELEFLMRFQEELEPDDGYMLVAIDTKADIFNTSFLQQLDSFTRGVNALPYVLNAQSITTIKDVVKSPFGMMPVSLVHPQQAEKLPADEARLLKDERFLNNFYSADGSVATVVVKLKERLQQGEAEEFVEAFSNYIAPFNFPEFHVVSRAHTQTIFVEKIESEMLFFVLLSLVLLVIILYLLFRTIAGVLIPMFSCLLALLLFMGFLGAIGFKLDLMSPLFPVLMITIAMSDVIHLTTKYIACRERGLGADDALRLTIKEIGWATLLTSVTTAIGFLASVTSPLEPIRLFSVMAAVGVMIAYLTTITFTMVALLRFDAQQLSRIVMKGGGWSRFIETIYEINMKRPYHILVATLLSLVVIGYGMSKVTTNTYLYSDVPRGDKLRNDFEFFEKKLSGARPYELAVVALQGSVHDPLVLQAAEKVEQHLKQVNAVGAVVGYTSLYKSLNKAYNGGSSAAYQLPSDEDDYLLYRRLLSSGDSYNKLVSTDGKLARITGRIKDLGSDSIRALQARLDNWILTNTDTALVSFKHTGTASLIDSNNEYLRRNLGFGLAIAFSIIALLMALLFRSFKMILVFLIPNIFPLLVCGAAMGYLGIELKASTSIIFMLSFGIAVDDTIHFLSHYKLKRDQGEEVRPALLSTFRDAGKAIIVTSIILFVCFFSLIFSDFMATYYIGLLMSLTFAAALVAELFITPLCIRLAYDKL